METSIKHVYGNVLKIAIPLTLRTITLENGQAVATNTAFTPSSNFPVVVAFSGDGKTHRFAASMREGGVAYIEDKGTIPVGVYAITVLCKDDSGNPYRFKQQCVLEVVDFTAEAGIDSGIEFGAEVWYLNPAIFLVLGGGGGGGTETDPVFSASPAATITAQDIIDWFNKQDALTFDNVPTENSSNPVKSGGVKSAIDAAVTIPIITNTDPTTNDVSPVKNTFYYGSGTTEYKGTDEDFDDGCVATTYGDAVEGSSSSDAISRDRQGFYLEPNKFYELGYISSVDVTLENNVSLLGGLRLFCVDNSNEVVKEYMGRFTAIDPVEGTTKLTLTALTSGTSNSPLAITIPDDTPDLEDMHTYEFNISASVLTIKDITMTTT